MRQVVIENPVPNPRFEERQRHLKLTDEGITDEVIEARRVSSYHMPVAQPRKKGKELRVTAEWTLDRTEEDVFLNWARERVAMWFNGGSQAIASTTHALLGCGSLPWPDQPTRSEECACETACTGR